MSNGWTYVCRSGIAKAGRASVDLRCAPIIVLDATENRQSHKPAGSWGRLSQFRVRVLDVDEEPRVSTLSCCFTDLMFHPR